MPIKPHDPSRPTFYLDHSTLCDAFKAHKVDGGGVAPTYRLLKPWIELVAHEASLCLSTFHLAELARWEDTETADGMAHWYEGLPIVLVRSRVDVLDAEDEYWTKIAAGLLPEANGHAFAPSLIAAFRDPNQDEIDAIGRQKDPLVAMLRVMRLRDHDADIAQFLKGAERFRADRAWAEQQGWTDDRKRDQTAYNVRCELRRRAMEADRRLSVRKDPAYAAKTCSGGDVQDLLVQLFAANPKALPCFRVSFGFNEGVCEVVLRKAEGSKGLHRALRGSPYDWLHLVGAAYCDVFTCDGEVSRWLGDLRVGFGLARQMSAKSHPSGPEGFVKALMATWP